MRRHVLCAFLLIATSHFVAPPLVAQSQSAPGSQEWLEELQKKGGLKSVGKGLFPAVVLAVESLPKAGKPELADIDEDEFNKIGFLKLASTANLEYFFKLNEKPQGAAAASKTKEKGKGKKKNGKRKAKGGEQPVDWMKILLEVTGADTVLMMPKKEKWEVIQNVNGKPTSIVTHAAGAGRNAKAVHSWLVDRMGYEGVILDRKGNYFFVGMLANVEKQDTQALVLKDTAEKFALTEVKKEGAGLMQLSNKHEGFGVFELLLGEKAESVEPGTKIVIETKSEKATKPARSEKAEPAKADETSESDNASAEPADTKE